jgi:hypothetical protein
MGSKGSKPRKPQHSQHLPKVGSAPENERLQHAERHAVVDNMSFGGRSGKKSGVVIGTIAVIFVIGAIGGLILLVALR